MNIAIFDINKEEQREIKKQIKKHNLLFFATSLQDTPVAKYANADIISIFIYSKASKDILQKCKKLKALCTRSTGFDHIDLGYCKKNKIQVANVPTYGENTVAEHTFALILSLSRNIHKSYIRTTHDDYHIDDLRGFDLKGKTLGVIGTGHIGMHVIKMAKGFGMHVKAYDVRKSTFVAELLHFEYADIDNLLKESDIISLHMPYIPQTHHFLNKKRLKATKKGVIVINTARGALIDTNALYHLLKEKHIGGAGLDVIEGEELLQNEDSLLKDTKTHSKLKQFIKNKEILKMPNVIFTPHNAFNSEEALLRILDTTCENINFYIKDKKVKHPVPM